MRRSVFIEEESFEEPLINLTPLIDVVFVVLIAFMLLAPILNVQDVELAQGGNDLVPCSAASPLTLTVRKDNTLWFQGKETSFQDLPQQLARAKKEYPHVTPQLIHDRKAMFGTYQKIKTALENAGFVQMDLVLER